MPCPGNPSNSVRPRDPQIPPSPGDPQNPQAQSPQTYSGRGTTALVWESSNLHRARDSQTPLGSSTPTLARDPQASPGPGAFKPSSPDDPRSPRHNTHVMVPRGAAAARSRPGSGSLPAVGSPRPGGAAGPRSGRAHRSGTREAPLPAMMAMAPHPRVTSLPYPPQGSQSHTRPRPQCD